MVTHVLTKRLISVVWQAAKMQLLLVYVHHITKH